MFSSSTRKSGHSHHDTLVSYSNNSQLGGGGRQQSEKSIPLFHKARIFPKTESLFHKAERTQALEYKY